MIGVQSGGRVCRGLDAQTRSGFHDMADRPSTSPPSRRSPATAGASGETVSNTLWARGGKRAVDLVLSLVGFAIASPILLLAIALMKLTSPGPILYTQVRTGKNGKPFQPYKLRTMTAGRKHDPNEIVPLDHAAITRAGRMLRRFKIDELPQILNVVSGDMAMLGPRPTLPEQTREYDAFKKQRLLVRPGLTGLAQVNGNAVISWDERIKYDVHYVRHHGLVMDVGILAKTLLVVILGEERFARPFDESPYTNRQ